MATTTALATRTILVLLLVNWVVSGPNRFGVKHLEKLFTGIKDVTKQKSLSQEQPIECQDPDGDICVSPGYDKNAILNDYFLVFADIFYLSMY